MSSWAFHSLPADRALNNPLLNVILLTCGYTPECFSPSKGSYFLPFHKCTLLTQSFSPQIIIFHREGLNGDPWFVSLCFGVAPQRFVWGRRWCVSPDDDLKRTAGTHACGHLIVSVWPAEASERWEVCEYAWGSFGSAACVCVHIYDRSSIQPTVCDSSTNYVSIFWW